MPKTTTDELLRRLATISPTRDRPLVGPEPKHAEAHASWQRAAAAGVASTGPTDATARTEAAVATARAVGPQIGATPTQEELRAAALDRIAAAMKGGG